MPVSAETFRVPRKWKKYGKVRNLQHFAKRRLSINEVFKHSRKSRNSLVSQKDITLLIIQREINSRICHQARKYYYSTIIYKHGGRFLDREKQPRIKLPSGAGRIKTLITNVRYLLDSFAGVKVEVHALFYVRASCSFQHLWTPPVAPPSTFSPFPQKRPKLLRTLESLVAPPLFPKQGLLPLLWGRFRAWPGR